VIVAAAGSLIAADRFGVFGRQPAADRARYDGKTFTCIRVIDGDTLDVDIPDGKDAATRIRLWGIDTPELGHDDRQPQHFAPEAAAFVRRLAEGKSVTLRLEPHDNTRGRHDRLLAYVILPDGQMLNRILLEDGYAYADPRYDHSLKREFLQLQDRARTQRLGLWAAARPTDLPDYWQGRLTLPQN